MTESILLRCEKLTKFFVHEEQNVRVLNDLDLAVTRGESVAIVGASGAGKSTLLHLLGALDEPSSGRIIFDGIDLATLDAKQKARFRSESIGFMFQFHHLLPEFTAVENVMMPLLIAKVRRSDAEAQARDWLDRVGLSHRFTHRPSELSGGEQQRVALARALIRSPALLLADEPTGNLDQRTGQSIHNLFTELSEAVGTSMIIVTHNQQLASEQSRQLALVDGRLTDEEG